MRLQNSRLLYIHSLLILGESEDSVFVLYRYKVFDKALKRIQDDGQVIRNHTLMIIYVVC